VRGGASAGGVQRKAWRPAGKSAASVETACRVRFVSSTRRTTRARFVSVNAIRAVGRDGVSVVRSGPSPANGRPPFEARKSRSLGALGAGWCAAARASRARATRSTGERLA